MDARLDLAALVEEALRAEASPVALISRSGLNLRAIGHRYSHSGWVRRASADPAAPEQDRWSVRQLYFDCDTAQPRVFDEGLAGFVRGVSDGTWPRLSVVWWPAQAPHAPHAPHTPHAPAERLARAVGDSTLALALLAPQYQAQAHVWNLHTQNCNQWLVEMLAAAFGGVGTRSDAQDWLRRQGYAGSVVQLPWAGWLLVAALWPHMGLQHHPPENLQSLRFEVSLPDSVERFVRQQWPQARRMEWCLRGPEVVVRRSWEPLDDDCTPGPGDERRPLSN
jgi:hypothetical protein